MKSVSNNSRGNVKNSAQSDADANRTSSSEESSDTSGSHRGRLVAPTDVAPTDVATANVEDDKTSNIPSVASYLDEKSPPENSQTSEKPLTSRDISGDIENRMESIASHKRNEKKRRSKPKPKKPKKPKSEVNDPVRSAEVIEWEGSIDNQLKKLDSNVKAAMESEQARAAGEKTVAGRQNKPDSNSETETARKPNGNHSSFRTLDRAKQNKVTEEERHKELDYTTPGFFHLNHPGSGIKMSRNYLLAHLEIVEKIEDILIEVLKSSKNKTDIHSLDATALDEILSEIETCLDEWMELPPGDTTIYPREALKQLIDQYRDEYGNDLENDAKQMDFFLGQCRQLFPIDESGMLHNTGNAEKPAPRYYRELSEKIKDMLKYQSE